MSQFTSYGASNELSLIPGDTWDGGGQHLAYDEEGTIALARGLLSPEMSSTPGADRAGMNVKALNGSWFVQFVPEGPHVLQRIRGPLRLEVSGTRMRISGDIYVRTVMASQPGPVSILEPITENPLVVEGNWYPHLPFEEYRWHFRSTGVSYDRGVLTFRFVRHLWDPVTKEFTRSDTAWMRLNVAAEPYTHPRLPQPTLAMSGSVVIGGQEYRVTASKTSPYYRGCRVEVGVMKNRTWPADATTCAGAAISFAGIYRAAGMDCSVVITETDLPEKASLTVVEMNEALAKHRAGTTGDFWRLWLLVGSRHGGVLGIMFDQQEPHRQGAAGFADLTLNGAEIDPSARGKRVGDVPSAFLRTLVHEAGHAFNLYHPKDDVHGVPIDTTLMNQTGDVMGFATPGNLYPCNAAFAFDEHNRTSLIHSPDPQVAPGWKRFGWGHGSFSQGVPEPTDAGGLDRDPPVLQELTLSVDLPRSIFRGEFVAARFRLKNIGTTSRSVSSAFNLAQGDLRLLITPPGGEPQDARDAVIVCGERELITLEPGESLESVAQIFYTNLGLTFRQTGRYYVSAEFHVGSPVGCVVRSAPVEIVVRSPHDSELEISTLAMNEGVGRAFALGDPGRDEAVIERLRALATRYSSGDAAADALPDADPAAANTTGTAAALVLANSFGRALHDLHTGRAVRGADEEEVRIAMDQAAEGTAPERLVELAVAVVAPSEGDAPVLDRALDHVRTANNAEDTLPGADAASAGAERLLQRLRRSLGSAG